MTSDHQAKSEVKRMSFPGTTSRHPERNLREPERETSTQRKHCKSAPPWRKVNTTYPLSDDLDFDLDSIIDSLDTFSCDEEYQTVPDKVSTFIDRLCREHNVETPVWNQSPTKHQVIYVLGRGVEKIAPQLVEEAKALFPGFEFVLQESGPLHTIQYSNRFTVHKREESATCELILTAGTGSTPRPYPPPGHALFAVAPAHQILNVNQQQRLLGNIDPQLTNDVRTEIMCDAENTRCGLLMHGSNNNAIPVDLKHPAMISYRHYYDAISTTTDSVDYKCSSGKCTEGQLDDCPHDYLNDIAVHQIAPNSVTLVSQHQQCGNVRFSQIRPITSEQIEAMIERRSELCIRQMQCRLVNSFETPRPGTDARYSHPRKYAKHVTFIVPDQRNALTKGDSGSILYMKCGNHRIALAMFIGKVNLPQEEFYQAVLLNPGLKDIEMEYSDLVNEFHVFQCATVQSSAQPPSQLRNGGP